MFSMLYIFCEYFYLKAWWRLKHNNQNKGYLRKSLPNWCHHVLLFYLLVETQCFGGEQSARSTCQCCWGGHRGNGVRWGGRGAPPSEFFLHSVKWHIVLFNFFYIHFSLAFLREIGVEDILLGINLYDFCLIWSCCGCKINCDTEQNIKNCVR